LLYRNCKKKEVIAEKVVMLGMIMLEKEIKRVIE
jgi:hypothetical protein